MQNVWGVYRTVSCILRALFGLRGLSSLRLSKPKPLLRRLQLAPFGAVLQAVRGKERPDLSRLVDV